MFEVFSVPQSDPIVEHKLRGIYMSRSKDNKNKSGGIRRIIDWLPELVYILMYIPRLTMKLIRGVF